MCWKARSSKQPFQLPHAEPVGERRVDVEGLLRDGHFPILGHGVERAHVVQPVGKLDDDDAHVLGHRHEHLADACGPCGLVRVLDGTDFVLAPGVHELVLRELGHAVYERGDLFTEMFSQLLVSDGGVLDHVVQQRGAQCVVVEVEVDQVEGRAQGVFDERLAGLAVLAGVGLFGEPVGLFDGGDLVGRKIVTCLVEQEIDEPRASHVLNGHVVSIP